MELIFLHIIALSSYLVVMDSNSSDNSNTVDLLF